MESSLGNAVFILVLFVAMFLVAVVIIKCVEKGTKTFNNDLLGGESLFHKSDYTVVVGRPEKKGWTEDELIIICYCVLFEEVDYENKELLRSLSEGLGTSPLPIIKKIDFFKNIHELHNGSCDFEKNIYLLMGSLGKEGCENMLQKAIKNVIN